MRTILASTFEMGQRKSQMFRLDAEAQISSNSRPLFPTRAVATFYCRPPPRMADQLSLFDLQPGSPDGFRYCLDFLDEEEERSLVAEIERLPFKEFEFHGFAGRRRVVSFGWRYDFNDARLREAEPIPGVPASGAREGCALCWTSIERAFEQLLVTEYEPGAAIGWHRDRAVFADVIGVSLLAPCTFRFRKKEGAAGGAPRSALRLAPPTFFAGPVRTEWEHSIPGVERLRYSLTFRNFRAGSQP